MISNLTLNEVKEFFKGDLISSLKNARFYVQPIEGDKYQVQSTNMNVLGYIERK